jgi:hypothetical protein
LGGEDINEEMEPVVKELIMQCINSQKEVRVTFADLTANNSNMINNIRMQMTESKHYKFADFWTDHGFGDTVEFDTFFPAFKIFFDEVFKAANKKKEPEKFSDEDVRFFKHALGVAVFANSKSEQYVRLEVYQGFLNRFGDALDADLANLLKQITTLYRSPWFFSNFNQNEAVALLQSPKAKARNFIIRYSSDPNLFTLSKVMVNNPKDKKDTVINHRQLKDPGTNIFQIVNDIKSGTSSYLEERKKYTPPSDSLIAEFPPDHAALAREKFGRGFHGGYDVTSHKNDDAPEVYGGTIAHDDTQFVV